MEDITNHHRVTYMISRNNLNITTASFAPVALFPWSQAQHKNYKLGKLIFAVNIGDNPLNVKLVDTNKKVYAEELCITKSGVKVINVDSPNYDTVLELQFKSDKFDPKDSPKVTSVLLEFENI